MPSSSQSPLPSSVTLAELESHLWEAANILRGSPVDRTDWKSYILPLLFFKRICDVWDEEHAAMLTEYGEDFADEHRFQVPEGCHWSAVRRAPKNVGAALAHALRGIEAANQKHLYGVFGDARGERAAVVPRVLRRRVVAEKLATPGEDDGAEPLVEGSQSLGISQCSHRSPYPENPSPGARAQEKLSGRRVRGGARRGSSGGGGPQFPRIIFARAQPSLTPRAQAACASAPASARRSSWK